MLQVPVQVQVRKFQGPYYGTGSIWIHRHKATERHLLSVCLKDIKKLMIRFIELQSLTKPCGPCQMWLFACIGLLVHFSLECCLCSILVCTSDRQLGYKQHINMNKTEDRINVIYNIKSLGEDFKLLVGSIGTLL